MYIEKGTSAILLSENFMLFTFPYILQQQWGKRAFQCTYPYIMPLSNLSMSKLSQGGEKKKAPSAQQRIRPPISLAPSLIPQKKDVSPAINIEDLLSGAVTCIRQ